MGGIRRLDPIELCDAVPPKQPQGLLAQPPCYALEITATEKHGTSRKRIQQMPGAIPLRIEETSSVVVAESRKLATSPQQAKNIQHSFKSLVECGNRREVIQRSQNTCMQEEVYRIDVIVSGLFEVESIGAHLALRFLLHNLPSSFTPGLRGLELRAEHSDEEKRNTFSEQVSVRRKISREMNINVASGDSQRPKPLRAKLRGHALGALKQEVHPNPRQASERHLKTAGPVHTDGIWILSMPALPLPE